MMRGIFAALALSLAVLSPNTEVWAQQEPVVAPASETSSQPTFMDNFVDNINRLNISETPLIVFISICGATVLLATLWWGISRSVQAYRGGRLIEEVYEDLATVETRLALLEEQLAGIQDQTATQDAEMTAGIHEHT